MHVFRGDRGVFLARFGIALLLIFLTSATQTSLPHNHRASAIRHRPAAVLSDRDFQDGPDQANHRWKTPLFAPDGQLPSLLTKPFSSPVAFWYAHSPSDVSFLFSRRIVYTQLTSSAL
jgi:hypothetical protein